MSSRRRSHHAKLVIRGWVNDLSEQGLTAKRQAAQTRLEAAGEQAVPALMTALHSNDVNTRRNAADVLGFIASTRATDALVQSLANDPAAAVRECGVGAWRNQGRCRIDKFGTGVGARSE